jgi:hypothetical protein
MYCNTAYGDYPTIFRNMQGKDFQKDLQVDVAEL